MIFSIPLGKEDATQNPVSAIRLLVSAKVLSVASRTFSAMLSPAYLEGQALSSDDPPTIEFAEDSGEPFHILCCLLHHKKIEEHLISRTS